MLNIADLESTVKELKFLPVLRSHELIQRPQCSQKESSQCIADEPNLKKQEVPLSLWHCFWKDATWIYQLPKIILPSPAMYAYVAGIQYCLFWGVKKPEQIKIMLYQAPYFFLLISQVHFKLLKSCYLWSLKIVKDL